MSWDCLCRSCQRPQKHGMGKCLCPTSSFLFTFWLGLNKKLDLPLRFQHDERGRSAQRNQWIFEWSVPPMLTCNNKFFFMARLLRGRMDPLRKWVIPSNKVALCVTHPSNDFSALIMDDCSFLCNTRDARRNVICKLMPSLRCLRHQKVTTFFSLSPWVWKLNL